MSGTQFSASLRAALKNKVTHQNGLLIFMLQVKLRKISGVNLLTSSLKSCNVLEHVLVPATQALPETFEKKSSHL